MNRDVDFSAKLFTTMVGNGRVKLFHVISDQILVGQTEEIKMVKIDEFSFCWKNLFQLFLKLVKSGGSTFQKLRNKIGLRYIFELSFAFHFLIGP